MNRHPSLHSPDRRPAAAPIAAPVPGMSAPAWSWSSTAALSIKFALFAAHAASSRTPWWRGQVTGHRWRCATVAAGDAPRLRRWRSIGRSIHAALGSYPRNALARLEARRVVAVAHRGARRQPVPCADRVGWRCWPTCAAPLAPLHQPFALEAIEVLLRERPELPQVACFDTAFHHTLAPGEQVLPCLRAVAAERGLRRYGFHGLSYAYIASAPERHRRPGQRPLPRSRTSAAAPAFAPCASCAASPAPWAFRPDGLMMGTRCGAFDPGALLYLMHRARV